MTTLLTLGQRIRQAREQAHIRQVELARRIGISANALNSIEHGETDPRVSRVVAIVRQPAGECQLALRPGRRHAEAEAPADAADGLCGMRREHKP